MLLNGAKEDDLLGILKTIETKIKNHESIEFYDLKTRLQMGRMGTRNF